MINLIWVLMMAVSVIYAAAHGNIDVISTAAFDATEEGITLILEIAGVMMLWMGLLKIMEESGLLDILAKIIRPIVQKLFPELGKNNPAFPPIIMNISANLLGLGNAATPFGLKAMTELNKSNSDKKTANNSMITLLILNTSSITLIPALLIGIRSGFNSVSPEAIVVPTIIATTAGCVAGLSLHFLICKFNK